MWIDRTAAEIAKWNQTSAQEARLNGVSFRCAGSPLGPGENPEGLGDSFTRCLVVVEIKGPLAGEGIGHDGPLEFGVALGTEGH